MTRTCLVASAILFLGLAPAGLEKVKLQFKHVEGSSRSVESTSKTHQILSVMGQDIETKAENKLTLVASVGKRGANGRLPIEQKIEAINLQLNTPAFNVNIDSSNLNQKDDNPMIQAIIDTIRARVGTAHTVVLDENNKVVGIEGIDKILAKASPAAAENLKTELDPEQMKKAAEQAFGILPTEPVGEGDTWTRTMVTSIGGGQTLTFETKFEYLGTIERGGKKLDKIATSAESVTYAMAPNPQAQVKITQSNLKVETSKGVILFDRDKGFTVESNMLQHVVGDMTLSIGGMDLPSKLDLTIDSGSVAK